MKYSVVHLVVEGVEEWHLDLLTQDLADIGFDSFQNTDDDHLDAYIPTSLLHLDQLQEVLSRYEDISAEEPEDCPDENWNAIWESEHEVEELPMGVRIIPHCAFGAGHHETTGMMIDALTKTSLAGKTVLDNGTGTGILGIMAMKCGAANVVAVDFDENSVNNAIENAEINGIHMEVLLGDTPAEGIYDLILANIHRNILQAQMPLYKEYTRQGGELWISGFIEEDILPLRCTAEENGFCHTETCKRGDWRMLRFTKK